LVWSFYESVCDDVIDIKKIRAEEIQWDKLHDKVNGLASYLPSFNHDAKLYWKWFEKEENYSLFKK
jgi:hypothetical protein